MVLDVLPSVSVTSLLLIGGFSHHSPSGLLHMHIAAAGVHLDLGLWFWLRHLLLEAVVVAVLVAVLHFSFAVVLRFAHRSC